MLKVIEVPEALEPSQVEEMGLLFPVPGGEPNTVVLEPRDGTGIERTFATGVVFQLGGETTFESHGLEMHVFVTDARFAFACTNYAANVKNPVKLRGPNSLGLNLMMTGVTKVAAKRRSRGKMLVGQIRYPWLAQVGSSPATGRRNSGETLYLEAPTKARGTLRMTISLATGVDGAAVATDIAQRAARYRLASMPVDDDARASLEAMVQTGPAVPGSDPLQIAWHTLPGADLVGERTARLSPATA